MTKRQQRFDCIGKHLCTGLANLYDAKANLDAMRNIYKADLMTWQVKNYELLTLYLNELVSVAKKINNVGRKIMAEFVDESDSTTLDDLR